jgi:hypothetical protein
MNTNDPTSTPYMSDDENNGNSIPQKTAGPQPITALRMARFLLPLNDPMMDLHTDEGLKRNRRAATSLLLWPPNLFAFTSEILSSTGAYYLVVSPAKDDNHTRKEIWPPDEYDEAQADGKTTNKWAAEVRRIGKDLREKLNKKNKQFFQEHLNPEKKFVEGELEQLLDELLPKEVRQYWEEAAAGFDTADIKDLLCVMEDQDERSKHWRYFVRLMTLHAIADEACLGWGIRKDVPGRDKTRTADDAQAFAEELLDKHGTLATIHEDRCRILPKRHTPNVGMTLRSISSNLAHYHRSSMEVKWRPSVKSPLTQDGEPIKSLNALLIPWPYKIYSRDFGELEGAPFQANTRVESFFEYRPYWNSDDQLKNEDWFIRHGLTTILEDAKQEAGRIDLVILPELALSKKNIDSFERKLEEAEVSGYIAGVRYDREKPNRFNRNMVYCKFLQLERGQFEFPPDAEDYIQQKHHRWKLDETQVIKYQLGGSLSPNKVWWEGIKLSRRKVTFINVGDEITICPLICEDLARQEPISDLIRAVGPTLVVAILMDGPQKMSRWSAGYSSVLADDPRSSVLTFTCLGMVEKMQAPGIPKSRAVALWKDPLNPPQEIELESNKKGIVLYLTVKQKKELTADGREEEVATPYLTLGGSSYI